MLAAALLSLLAQDAAAALTEEEPVEEIVVTATYGRTTMLFDKGADGKLYNCRILVSSGSQARDVKACGATPVCFEGTADEVTDCTELKINPAALFSLGTTTPRTEAPATPAKIPAELPGLGKLIAAPTPRPDQAGPRTAETAEETRDRLEKLPPPPVAPDSGPVIRLSAGTDED